MTGLLVYVYAHIALAFLRPQSAQRKFSYAGHRLLTHHALPDSVMSETKGDIWIQANGLLALEHCVCLFGLTSVDMTIIDKNRFLLLPLPLHQLVSATTI